MRESQCRKNPRPAGQYCQRWRTARGVAGPAQRSPRAASGTSAAFAANPRFAGPPGPAGSRRPPRGLLLRWPGPLGLPAWAAGPLARPPLADAANRIPGHRLRRPRCFNPRTPRGVHYFRSPPGELSWSAPHPAAACHGRVTPASPRFATPADPGAVGGGPGPPRRWGQGPAGRRARGLAISPPGITPSFRRGRILNLPAGWQACPGAPRAGLRRR